MSRDNVVAIRPGADLPLEQTAAERLTDEDSSACQVREFLRSVQPFNGLADPERHFEGRELIQDFILQLAVHGDDAPLPLTTAQIATLLRMLATMEPRPGCESYDAGGVVGCGFHIVLYWIERQVQALQPAVGAS